MDDIRKLIKIMSPNDELAIFIGILSWKREFIADFVDEEVVFVGRLLSYFLPLIPGARNKKIYCWGYRDPIVLRVFRMKLIRLEDGFIRSVGLGCNRVAPNSLVFDKSGTLYFDSRRESGLEKIIKSKKTLKENEVVEAKKLLNLIVNNGVTKYNLRENGGAIYPKGHKYVLVVGQCEDDLSIKYGSGRAKPWTVRDLLLECRRREGGAKVIYRQHPDVTAGKRRAITRVDEIKDLCDYFDTDSNLPDLMEKVDKVYVISSLTGFEALLRGKSVVTLGQPFYAGWGLTEDLTPFEVGRRGERRDILTLLYCSYSEYPEYYSYLMGRRVAVFDVLDEIRQKL